MTTDTLTDTPRIYVACLASYNSGRLYGAWIDATQDVDDIAAEVAAMLRGSPCPNVMVEHPDTGEQVASAEEWAIHDYDNFGGTRLSESESFENVSAIANAIEEHGEAFVAWLESFDGSADRISDFHDEYRGTFRSAEDYAADFVDSCGLLHGVDETLRNYFDYEAYARDMGYNGVAFIPGGDGVLVFEAC